MSEEHASVVVVGTGFGGAVSACRLAQGGQDVVVLERGRRYGPGDFPRGIEDDWLWGHDGGLFDFRPLSEVVLIQAAGYGGGSLLYSNVHLRLPEEGFALRWPHGWTRDGLDPYYDLVAHMLELTPIQDTQPLGAPPRTCRMEEAADRDRRADVFRPPLAVRLTTPNAPTVNRHGVTQVGCTHCTECSIGCNIKAKNTLDLNYLEVAERRGAAMRTSCEVTGLARHVDGYRVAYTDLTTGRECAVVAGTVILAAGTANTTEMLLRDGGALGVLSELVGHRYSANGDFLALGRGLDSEFVPTCGPAITASIRYSEGPRPGDPWFLVQDGGFPAPFARNLFSALARALTTEAEPDRALAAAGSGSRELRRLIGRVFDPDRLDLSALSRLLDDALSTDHVAVLLAMGRDTSDGVVRNRRWWPHPWVDWHVTPNLPLYEAEQALCDEIIEELGGQSLPIPGWGAVRLPITVHSLGGAVMATDADHGVVDPHGEVFGCPGLFVFDGAAIPSATGVNPSHTIAAVAERNVERLVRRLSGLADWQAPETAAVRPHHDPLPPTPGEGTCPVDGMPAVTLMVTASGELAGVDWTRTHRLRLAFDLVGPAPPSRPLALTGCLEIDGLGSQTEGEAVRGAVLRAEGGGEWRWTVHFALGPDAYVLRGRSNQEELRLSLHRGLRPENRPLAVGLVVIEVDS